MAFGKKDKDPAPPAIVEPELAPESEVAADAIDPIDELPAPEPEAAAAPEPATAADPLGGGADALLSMFQSTEVAGEDRSIYVDLAGNVDIDDLLESLQTVAAALGIVAATAAESGAEDAPLADLYDEDEDYEAAA